MGSSMNMQEMESKYSSLRQARNSGGITDAQFRNDVAQLRFQAADGFWYQIDPSEGQWLKWNGQTYEKATPPAAPQQQVPKKFFPLLGYILKQAWKIFKKQLPMMIIFGILGWVLHTYLLVFINQGFGAGNVVGDFLATQGFGNTLSGTIIWMVVSGFLFGWLGQLIANRGKKVAKRKQPALMTLFHEAGGLALAAILATAGLSLFIGIILNKYAGFTLALGAVGLMLSKAGAVVSLLISSAWSSTYGLAQNKKSVQFSAATGRVAMVGSIAGFLICFFLTPPLWKLILGICMLIAAFVLTRRQGQSMTALLLSILPIMLLFGVIALIMKAIPVLADDGGWQESGGTFSGWVHSSGAVQAVTQGVGPGVGTAVGPAVGQALTTIGGSLPTGDGGDTGDGGEVTPQPEPPALPVQPVTMTDENGYPITNWEPGKYGPGADGNEGKPGQVWYNGNWVDAAQAQAAINTILGGPVQKINMADEDGKPIINWEPGKYGPDTKGNVGKPGMVWHWGEWVTPEQAQQEIQQDLNRQAQDRAEQDRSLAEWRQKNAEQLEKERAEAQRSLDAANQRQAQEAAQAKYDQQLRDHILSKLKDDPAVGQEIRDLAAKGDTEGLKDIYKDKLGVDMTQSQKDAAYYNRMSTIYGAGEVGAKLIVAGSKGALIAIGGPAGMLVTGVAVGSISAAQEGTQSYVNGDSAAEILGHTAVGFASGVKDGAIGVYTQMPGVSTAAKYLIPAGADAAQTFIQAEINDPGNVTGNLGKALGSGALSIGTTYVGNFVDANTSGLVKEELNLATGAAGGAIGNVIQGGNAGEGALEGLIGAAGGRVGGHLGTAALDYARTQSEEPVQTAIGHMNQMKKDEIGILDQSQKIQDLAKTKTEGENGKTYVDEAGALNQLRDTQSSRTAKQSPKDIQDAIIATRADKIYKPADDATVAKATETLSKLGKLQPGDKVAMDTFSTPGKPPSLGADRDARLVIERANPETPGKTEKIEVDRQHWENDAYKDFYDHTTKLAGGPEAITPENYPNYFKRIDEMTHNNPEGLTPDQIQQRAWAEEHNQLFTDKNHVEASRDNSDQLNKFVNGQETPTQVTPNVVLTQQGKSTLLDPEGYAKMWHEKSDVYARMGNQPEAIAQSQKGIEQYMKIRQGYDNQGLNVPPLDNQTSKAMDIVTRAPVGVDATPERMALVNKQLQSLGFKDTNDALGKIAMQNETLGFAQPKGLSSANTTRIGISGIDPPPRDPADGTAIR